MAPSATVTLTESAPAPLPAKTLKTSFGAYKELGASKLDEQTERLGREDFEAAKVRRTMETCSNSSNYT